MADPLREKPAQLKKAELLEILDDIRARVESGDSFEGRISYEFPDDWDNADFAVYAMYRVGNLRGQGGYTQIGGFEEAPK